MYLHLTDFKPDCYFGEGHHPAKKSEVLTVRSVRIPQLAPRLQIYENTGRWHFGEGQDMEAKAILKRLQASGYGDFPDGQLRTLQRRVQVWRKQIVQQLVYGTEQPMTEATKD
jgi:hypothetical protein